MMIIYCNNVRLLKKITGQNSVPTTFTVCTVCGQFSQIITHETFLFY